LEESKFAARGRSVAYVRVKGEDSIFDIFVGGRKLIGFDGFTKDDIKRFPDPKKRLADCTEVTAIDVWIDKKHVVVPKRLFNDLINPNTEKPAASATLSKNGKRLDLELAGSDGAGSWTATWHITSTGKVTRSMEGPP
jgi:hypothetical protein